MRIEYCSAYLLDSKNRVMDHVRGDSKFIEIQPGRFVELGDFVSGNVSAHGWVVFPDKRGHKVRKFASGEIVEIRRSGGYKLKHVQD